MTRQSERAARNGEAFVVAVDLMARLRGPDGCAWDREQSFDSLKRFTLEETYEVFDAIERLNWPDLKDELGDMLLQVLFYSQMADESGHFTIEDVVRNLSAKLVRRHPHIFGDAVAHTAADVSRTWQAIKQAEKAARPRVSAHYLNDVASTTPAMLEAAQLGKLASKTGFDWPDVKGLFAKLREEMEELHEEVTGGSSSTKEAVEDELGDLLFTAVNLARHLQIEPEFALRRANRKFRERFNYMESAAGGIEVIRSSTPEQMDSMWNAAKAAIAAAANVPPEPSAASPEACE